MIQAPASMIVGTRTWTVSGSEQRGRFHSRIGAKLAIEEAWQQYDLGNFEIATGRTVADGVVTEHLYAIPRRVRRSGIDAPRRRFA